MANGMSGTQQAQAQVVAEQHQREVERKRFQAEAEMVPPPAMKPSAYYNSRLPPKSHRHTDVETGKIMERGTERGFDGRLEDGAAADLDDWLVSLRAESAALPQPAQPKAGRRGGSRRGREELLGPGPSVVESDGTWSPPPSPPRRQRGMKSRPVDASAEGEGAKSAAAKVPGPRKAVTGVSKAAHAIVFSSPPLQPPAGRGGRCNEESMGKGLSNDIVAMLEEDARAFHDVLLARVLRTCLTNWRDQAEIGVMSCRSR